MTAALAEQETKSTHKVEVVPVALEPHPNADSLSVVRVFGYTCLVRTEDWRGITTAAYLPPDSVVDTTRPEFRFLADQAKVDGSARIKAKKLRGVVSFGLLVPAPDGAALGDDVADLLGVTHYEPPLEHEKRGGGSLYTGGEIAPAPALFTVKYDVDAFRRYHHLFVAGEPVLVTEKLDGASARYVWHDGKMHVGSRNEWKKEFPDYAHVTVSSLMCQATANGRPIDRDRAEEIIAKLHSQQARRNLWWDLLGKTPALEKFCRDHPDTIVHGEVYGSVNCIKYGLPDGNRFAAFDLMRDGQWIEALVARDLLAAADVPQVPTLDCGRGYDFDTVCALAEGPTAAPDAKQGTIREGCVVKPLTERRDEHIGRVCFKAVSAAFLERYR
jgi:RNA ligase (TIGR02306 family)